MFLKLKLLRWLVLIALVGAFSIGAISPAEAEPPSHEQMNLPSAKRRLDKAHEKQQLDEFFDCYVNESVGDAAGKLIRIADYYQKTDQLQEFDKWLEVFLAHGEGGCGSARHYNVEHVRGLCRELRKKHQDSLVEKCLKYQSEVSLYYPYPTQCATTWGLDYSGFDLHSNRCVEEAAKCRAPMEISIPADCKGLRLTKLYGLSNIRKVSIWGDDNDNEIRRWLPTLTGLREISVNTGVFELLDCTDRSRISHLHLFGELSPSVCKVLDKMPRLKVLEVELGHVPLDLLPKIGQLKQLEEVRLRSFRLERSKVEAVLGVLPQMEKLSKLSLYGSALTPEDLAAIAACKNLKELDLRQTRLKASDITLLIPLTSLEVLEFDYSNDADEWLPYVSQLVGLKKLFIGQVSQEKLELLKKMRNLEEVSLPTSSTRWGGSAQDKRAATSKMRDQDLVFLAELPNLRSVRMRYPEIDGSIFSFGFMGLQTLELWHSPVTDSGLENIANLPELQSLSLSGSKITGRNILCLTACKLSFLSLIDCFSFSATAEELCKLQSLKEIYLNGTNVSWVELHKLKKAMPHCKIHPDPDELEALLTSSEPNQ